MMTAVYPGSFDPLTYGHTDIIERASRIADRLYITILTNSFKQPFLPVETRAAHLEKYAERYGNVEIEVYGGLLADYARDKHAVIIKGLRSASDYEYETVMAAVNKYLPGETETLFLPAAGGLSYLSSTVVREIAARGGPLDGLTPDYVAADILEYLKHSDMTRGQ